MARKLDYSVGDLDHGQIVQVSQALDFIPVQESHIVWDAHESLTVSSTALTLTANLRENADVVLITIEDAPVRFFTHGAVPTTTTGHKLEPGEGVELYGRAEIDQFRIIYTISDAKALCSYGRRVLP